MGKFLVKYRDLCGEEVSGLPLPAALTVLAIVFSAGVYSIISAIGLGAFLKGLFAIVFLVVMVFAAILTIWSIVSVVLFFQNRNAARRVKVKNNNYDNQHAFMEKQYCHCDHGDDDNDKEHRCG
jgi:membrane protein implicated in regulation of membrane protease activity